MKVLSRGKSKISCFYLKPPWSEICD